MKQLLIGMILVLSMMQLSQAGTCTSISRTNAAALSVLTSTKYNTDLNTAYTAVNNFDGGCVTDGTLESTALNATDFAVLLKGVQAGCKVSYTNASTLSISKCLASVNGALLNKTTATSVAMACTGCSSETSSTTYYVYIQTGSSGSTLTPLILTTAPNEDGYDNSGNKVLARFYNNASSNIDQYSIDQWITNRFVATNTAFASYTPSSEQGFGTTTNKSYKWRRVGDSLEVIATATTGTAAASEARVSFPNTELLVDSVKITTISLVGDFARNVSTNEKINVLASGGNSYVNFATAGSGQLTAQNGSTFIGNSSNFSFVAKVPITG